MCGVLGGFWREESPGMEARFSAALDLLTHRGPDDHGVWSDRMPPGYLALGHRRLSIIDLSEAGHQPMHSQDGRYTIVFNGEIYNYKELRVELAQTGFDFHSNSDTEVLLCAWRLWGRSCLSRLIGMFAFAVYDKTERTLTLVRDAFGIKPLFFSHHQDRFLFASEMPALLALEGQTPELNPQRVYDYLIHGVHDTGFGTFVRGVSHVPPAHLVRYDLADPGTFTSERWWNPDITRTLPLSFAQAAEALRELFLEGLRLHLRSDVSLGAALSGGIDSSSLVCGMRYLEPAMPIHTFSYISSDPAFSEERWVDIVNAHVGAEAHKVYVTPADLAKDLPDLIRTQGEPFGSTNMYAQYRVFQKAREDGVTVVLEGQGADELLAGYHGYAGQRMRSLLESGDLRGMVTFARRWKRWPGREEGAPWRALVGQLLPDIVYRAGLRFVGIDPLPVWMNRKALEPENISTRPVRPRRSAEGRRRRVAEVLSLALTEGGLPSLLRYGDRNAMRFSVENRVPFLTLPLAEFLLHLPEQYLISEKGETKSVFRAAMRGIVPDPILDRRDKIGFDTPMKNWLSSMIRTITQCVERTRQPAFLAADRINIYLEESVRDSKPLNWQIWRLVNLYWWSGLLAEPDPRVACSSDVGWRRA